MTADPFATMVRLAAARVFSEPVEVVIRLEHDPVATVQALITNPASFGPLIEVPPGARMTRINELVTVCKAYVANQQKLQNHDQSQPVLPLPGEEPIDE